MFPRMLLQNNFIIEDEEVNDNEIKLPEKAMIDYYLRKNYMKYGEF